METKGSNDHTDPHLKEVSEYGADEDLLQTINCIMDNSVVGIAVSDVGGVYTHDPKKDPEARLIKEINRKNWDQVRQGLGGSKAVDVTGGMAAKVSRVVEWARKGIRSRIVDATRSGEIYKALVGKRIGTEIRW